MEGFQALQSVPGAQQRHVGTELSELVSLLRACPVLDEASAREEPRNEKCALLCFKGIVREPQP